LESFKIFLSFSRTLFNVGSPFSEGPTGIANGPHLASSPNDSEAVSIKAGVEELTQVAETVEQCHHPTAQSQASFRNGRTRGLLTDGGQGGLVDGPRFQLLAVLAPVGPNLPDVALDGVGGAQAAAELLLEVRLRVAGGRRERFHLPLELALLQAVSEQNAVHFRGHFAAFLVGVAQQILRINRSYQT